MHSRFASGGSWSHRVATECDLDDQRPEELASGAAGDHHGPLPCVGVTCAPRTVTERGNRPGRQTPATADPQQSEKDNSVAVRLRLMRTGKKKQPTYRIVAADARSPRDGRFIEIVGTYDPRREPSAITVDNEKAIDWLKKGAQPSERVQKLLQISGAWDEFESSKAKK